MLEIEVFHCGPYPENCYLVWDSESKVAMIIDPGMTNARECRDIEGFIARHGLKLTHMVNTHLHFDHIWGVNFIKSTYGLPLEANKKDAELGMNAVRQALMFGQNPVGLQNVTIEKPLKQGDVIKVGKITFNVIETPGHTHGGITLYDAKDAIAFVGDNIFWGEIGKTDFPGGDVQEMRESLIHKIFALPNNTVMYLGHGPQITVHQEKQRYNIS